jgi:glutamyl-tRNA reductase
LTRNDHSLSIVAGGSSKGWEGNPEPSAVQLGGLALELSYARRCGDRVKIGLLGAGRIGALHAGVLTGNPSVKEVLVGDADSRRAERVAADVGGRVREH